MACMLARTSALREEGEMGDGMRRVVGRWQMQRAESECGVTTAGPAHAQKPLTIPLLVAPSQLMTDAPAPAERLPPTPADSCSIKERVGQHQVERVDVQCNGNIGTLLITTQAIVCKCAECTQSPCSVQRGGRVMTPTEFERHSGMSTSKKWRRSIKVVDGSCSMSVGRWLEAHGFSIEDGKDVRAEETAPPPPQMQMPPVFRQKQQQQQQELAERPRQLHACSSPFQRLPLDRTLSSQPSLFHFGLPTISPRQLHAHLQSAHLQPHEFPPQLLGLNKTDSSKDSDSQFYDKACEAARARSSYPGVTSAPGPSSAAATVAVNIYGSSKNNHRNLKSNNSKTCVAEEDVLLAARGLELLKAAPSLEPGEILM